jgi:hypothetical protein
MIYSYVKNTTKNTANVNNMNLFLRNVDLQSTP